MTRYLPWILSLTLLAATTACGFIAMRPRGTANQRRFFWGLLILFFLSLSWVFYRQTPWLFWVPLVPAVLFGRTAWIAERALAGEEKKNTD